MGGKEYKRLTCTQKWLRDDEREYVKARLRASQGESGAERKIKFKDVLTVMSDYKIWLGGFMYFGLIVPAYSYAYFAPTIIQSYKYDPITTQLRSVPPWVVSFGFSMVVAVFSDWAKHRFLFIIGAICIAITGFAILLTVHDNLQVQYAALFLTCMGTYSAMPVIVCWFNMNLAGHHRRAIGSAWQIGGFISVCVFILNCGNTDHNRFRQHWRHHLDVLVRQGRRAPVHQGLCHLRLLHLPERGVVCPVCGGHYLGEQEAEQAGARSEPDRVGEAGSWGTFAVFFGECR